MTLQNGGHIRQEDQAKTQEPVPVTLPLLQRPPAAVGWSNPTRKYGPSLVWQAHVDWGSEIGKRQQLLPRYHNDDDDYGDD